MVRGNTALLEKEWGIPQHLLDLAVLCEQEIQPQVEKIQAAAEERLLKVLTAFRSAELKEFHLQGSSGYGYHDLGRDAADKVFALCFGAEAALVRHQFVSGTHALKTALFGLLRPGDAVLAVPSSPYDTLHPLFGLRKTEGSLHDWGISVLYADPGDILQGKVDLNSKIKVGFIQRSKGYVWRDSISVKTIKNLIEFLREKQPDIQIVVDNCYGEFVEEKEPSEVGADLIAGSLIKNPGGGMALTGGYLAGRSEAVEKAASQFTAPGLGKAVGATMGMTRAILMGIFLSPRMVAETLKTAVFASSLFKALGYRVLPESHAERTDIIQAIELKSPGKVLAFAKGLQSAGPLDHVSIPEDSPMAGYQDRILMAGGSFVQGGSLELSCDAPMRPPYAVYLQGGLFSAHGILGVLRAAKEVLSV
jgi:cystathionine beta-lyase family protein involved in aluminum resistance